MKLAEALVLRADLQNRIEQLRGRLLASALVQEGDEPPENPQALFAELNDLLEQLAGLVLAINRTNLQTVVVEQTSITGALAQRDALDRRISILEQVASTASQRVDRYGRSEIRRVSTVDVAALRRELDGLAQQRRALDTAIQAANWTVDLVD